MKRTEIPSLDDLRALEAVARLGSVRAAAIELALTHGAVSRRVSKLGMDIGAALLEADGRGVRPTASGETLASATGQALGLISGALAAIRTSAAPAPIVLSCERSLAMRWLIPRLSEFQDAYPAIEVHLSTGGGALDFARERVTVAIRRLDFALDPGWAVTALMPERVGPVMPPSLRGTFDSGDYVALGSRTRPQAWQAWLEGQPTAPRPRSVRLLDHHFLMLEAALGGLDVALSPQAIAASEVKAGRLEAPAGFTADGTTYGLIQPRTSAISEDLSALRTWLMTQAAAL